MFTTVLCATDLTPSAQPAARIAAKLARESGAELHLVHVHRPVPVAIDPVAGALPSATLPVLEVVKEQLAQLAESLQVERPPSVHLEVGAPEAELILGVADRLGVELIVVGTAGRSGVKRLVFGSVAESVLRGSSVPVLTVPYEEAA